MDILNQLQQLEQLLVQPTLAARRQLYCVVRQLVQDAVLPYAQLGLMLHDQYGHPVVGGLEQSVWKAIWNEMAQHESMLLQRLFGGQTQLEQAQRQLLARYTIRQVNHVIRRLIELHQQHFIYLNREDIYALQALYQLFSTCEFARYFDLAVLEGLLQAPHPDVIKTSTTRMVGLV
jgi:hypothetical protein